ncbi:MAG: hypothetical protein NTX64_00160, partial [Elusimicrobia bacterium]|nr:hypothetical protein [Elusimicrobiota bacterium]
MAGHPELDLDKIAGDAASYEAALRAAADALRSRLSEARSRCGQDAGRCSAAFAGLDEEYKKQPLLPEDAPHRNVALARFGASPALWQEALKANEIVRALGVELAEAETASPPPPAASQAKENAELAKRLQSEAGLDATDAAALASVARPGIPAQELERRLAQVIDNARARGEKVPDPASVRQIIAQARAETVTALTPTLS